MNDDTTDEELIRQAATRYGIAPELLTRLLGLSTRFENFNIHGAKADFTRAVEHILDSAEAGRADGSKS